jgi:midasin (ATPase involved in ribosome maturation)
VVRIDE